MSALPGWMEASKTPGVALSLLTTGQPPRFACFGVQDLNSKRPVQPDTVFEAASLGKPLFAYAVLLLAQQGRLNLDHPLQAYLPESLIPGEERLERLTTRHVLSHSSGLPN